MSLNKKGTIGVIIASYNYGNFLTEAVESVLKQSVLPNEILISDDCSIDDTNKIALEYKRKYPNLIRVNRNKKNLGIIRHFNKAVSLISTDYICILGADNRLRNNYIEKTSQILDSNDKIAIAYTDFTLFGPRAKIEYERFPKNRKGEIKKNHYIIKFPDFNKKSKELLAKGNFIHGSSMFKKKAFFSVGGYIKEKERPEDHSLFLRLVKQEWQAGHIAEPLLEYRQHSVEQANIKLRSYLELQFYKAKNKEKEILIKQLNKQLQEKNKRLQKKDILLDCIYSSLGWKLTLPFKKTNWAIKNPSLFITKYRKIIYNVLLDFIKNIHK